MKNHIIIQDWAGNELFKGHYRSKEVDMALNANRCPCDLDSCEKCDGTGYWGDFEVAWMDETYPRNVYEFINY